MLYYICNKLKIYQLSIEKTLKKVKKSIDFIISLWYT